MALVVANDGIRATLWCNVGAGVMLTICGQEDRSINDIIAEIDQLYNEMSTFEPKFVDP